MFPVAGHSPHPLTRLRDFRLYVTNPTFANPAWEEALGHVLILRLSAFADVERSTPHLFLAGEVRRGRRSAFIDMAFLPRREDSLLMEQAGLPLILGTQSHRPLGDFDLVLLSNSYLLELANLPFLLSHSGVPLWSRQREQQWPLLILGGSNATASHALVSEDGDCMVDAIFFGEGEGVVAGMVPKLLRADRPVRRKRLDEIAAETDGLWQPGGEAREIHRARCDVGAAAAEPFQQPVLPGAEATTARLSITLGCPCLCSFCYEGYDRRPFREVPAEAIVAAARRLKCEAGASTLELASFNFNTHSELARLLIALNRLFLRVNLMSQRVDILARTPGLLDLELAADKRTFTLGIEGISGRQRSFLHKSLADADIRRAMEAVCGRRIREVKLFYILTGRETGDDFAELAGFVKWLKDLRRRADAPPRFVFSFGMLVRMPFTPLRHDPPVLSKLLWRPLLGRAKSICETNGLEFRLSHQWPEYAATQALALGDPSPAELLVRLSERGCVSGEGLPRDAVRDVEQWIEEHREWLLAEKPQDYGFAFSFLDTENSRKALFRQYVGAKAGKDAGYSGDQNRSGVSAESVRELAAITQAKHKLSPVHREAAFPREAAGLGTEWKESWLMRRFLALCPGQIDNVLSFRETLLEPSGLFGPDSAWFGKSVVAVTAWDLASFAQAARSVPELFGDEMPAFVPGTWVRLQMSLSLPARYFPDPAGRLAAFLKDCHAPVTIRRDGDSFELIVPEKSARKKSVLAGKGAQTADGTRMELVIGTRLPVDVFLSSFGSAAGEKGSARRSALVEVLSVR
jgi:radical SAM superfamily enzyme YgiQ (UPF0313 family)